MTWQTFGLLAGFAAALVAQATSAAWSQDESREERFFRYLDRNDDGRIAGDELSRIDGRMRDRLREAGLDPEKDIEKEKFLGSMKDRDSRRGEDSKKPKEESGKGSPKPRVILTLPSQFSGADKNGDNQIGLYEWDRAKFAEFLTLDRNGDGFLTARELDDAPRAADSSTTVVPGNPLRSTPTGDPRPEALPAAPGTNAAPPSAPVEPLDPPEVKQAKFYFGQIVDKNKDGKIAQDEWESSTGVRTKFEKANIPVSLPMNEATFVAKYVESMKKGKK